MYILGFLGSPKVNGLCANLLNKTLAGVKSRGGKTKKYDLIKCNIKHCIGCRSCFTKNPELPFGRCPLNDDMADILTEYVKADGFVFATPVYDCCVTSIMKKFLERKIALTYRPAEAHATIGEARKPANFQKKVSIIVTANCPEKFKEVMGNPCFEIIESHYRIEQADTIF